MSAWGQSWGSSWGNAWGATEEVRILFGGGLGRYKRDEDELSQEVEQVIGQIKESAPEQVEQVRNDAAIVSRKLQDAIAALNREADRYEAQLAKETALRSQEQVRELQARLIEAQLQSEILQQQAEELDVVYILFMLIAQI